MYMKKFLLLLLAVQLFGVQLLGAQDSLETFENSLVEFIDDDSGREIVFQLSSLPGTKLLFTQRYTVPFLEGSDPLTEDNNIAFALTAELSPVSINGIAETVWTPIAFFQLAAGGRIGSGWSINLFGKEIHGIGINKDDGTGKAVHSGSAFDGLLWKAHAGFVLQADYAAFAPGDWNHVVARMYHEISYSGYTRAKGNESWFFVDDDDDQGENVNGFIYYGNLFIGYQMPIILDMIGILTEAQLYLYDTPNRSSWGDERIRWKFALVGNIAFNEQFSMALLLQFRTVRNYREPDWEELYYRNRTIDKSRPVRFAFFQAALAATYKL